LVAYFIEWSLETRRPYIYRQPYIYRCKSLTKQKIMNYELKAELGRIKSLQQVRALKDDIGRAVFVLLYYCGDLKFSLRNLCSYFKISRPSLKCRLLSIFMGYTDHDINKQRYLAPFHEECLAEILKQRHDCLESVPREEVLLMVLTYTVFHNY